MPAALWIAHVEVTDPETYANYIAGATAAVANHGGTFLARGSRHRQMEGKDRARNVVIRFPSFEAAVACYESPEYQAALEFARPAAVRDLVIVEESIA